MKIYKILMCLAVFCTLSFGLSRAEIEPVMSQKVSKAVEILKDKAQSDKATKIFAMFDEYFDYKLMAKLSLSKNYKKLNDAQLSEFTKAYETRLKLSFIEKLELYSDQDMRVVGMESVNDKRETLKTQIISQDKNYDIDFKFYPADGGEWKIYDVDILGVSIVQTYRSQFGDVVENISFDELLNRLNKANLPDESVK